MKFIGNNSNIILAIIDEPHLPANVKEKCEQLTLLFSKFRSSNVILAKSVDEALEKVALTDKKYCLLQSIGHIIKSPEFVEYIETWVNTQDFFITGHIMQIEDQYGLHKQCLLVNLDYYRQFGKPKYGNKKELAELSVPIRSSTDIHDDYTPIWLKSCPDKETKVCTTLVDGWNFINVSLDNNLTVYNFHPKIREAKQYLYPYRGLTELYNQMHWLQQILEFAPQCIYFWNTEKYYSIKYSKHREKVKKLYTPAAGLKPLYILYRNGFFDDTEVIYYDYSKPALAFRRFMIENWDGRNYPKFIHESINKYQLNETTYTIDDYKKLWEEEMLWWKTEENLIDFWQKYKKLNHKFIHVDIVNEPQKLFKYIDNTPNSVIWWSNIFHTVNTHYTKTLPEIKKLYGNWLNTLNNVNPEMIVYGKDYLNENIEGLRVKECFNYG